MKALDLIRIVAYPNANLVKGTEEFWDSLMILRLLRHTSLMMTNRYCQAVGCYDAIESHKRYSPVDNLICTEVSDKVLLGEILYDD